MLKGKEILGFRPGSTPILFLEAAMRQNGIDPLKDVKLNNNVAIPARVGSWLAGQNQYAIFIEPDASQLELDGKAHFLASIGETVGPADYTTFMATDKYIRENPAVIQTWTDAIYKAQKWTARSAGARWSKTIEPFFPGVDPKALAAAAERYRKLEDLEEHAEDRAEGDREVPGHPGAGQRARANQAREVRRPRASPNSPTRRSDPWRHRHQPAPSPKVELRDVGLRYFGLEGETEALKDISLSIAPGEFVAIIGQSGCGKSTLLSLISGIIEPTERRGAGRRQAGRPGRAARSATCCSRTTCSSGAPSSKTRCSARKSRAPTWPRRASARRSFSPATGSASSCTICRASFRAACASAWRSRARSAPSRTSCCSTSRSRRSIRRPGSRSPTR